MIKKEDINKADYDLTIEDFGLKVGKEYILGIHYGPGSAVLHTVFTLSILDDSKYSGVFTNGNIEVDFIVECIYSVHNNVVLFQSIYDDVEGTITGRYNKDYIGLYPIKEYHESSS